MFVDSKRSRDRGSITGKRERRSDNGKDPEDPDDPDLVHHNKLSKEDVPRCATSFTVDLEDLDYNDVRDIIAIATHPRDPNLRHCYLRDELTRILDGPDRIPKNVYRLPIGNIPIDRNGYLLLTAAAPFGRNRRPVRDFRLQGRPSLINGERVYTVLPLHPEDEEEAKIFLGNQHRQHDIIDSDDESDDEQQSRAEMELDRQQQVDFFETLWSVVFRDQQNEQPQSTKTYVERVIRALMERDPDRYFHSRPVQTADLLSENRLVNHRYVRNRTNQMQKNIELHRARLYKEVIAALQDLIHDHPEHYDHHLEPCDEKSVLDLEELWQSLSLDGGDAQVAHRHRQRLETEKQMLDRTLCYHKFAMWILLFTAALAQMYRKLQTVPTPLNRATWISVKKSRVCNSGRVKSKC